jgi:hypothetical protein
MLQVIMHYSSAPSTVYVELFFVSFCHFCFCFGLDIIYMVLCSSEVGWCVALLEDSVNILLSCLETADSKMVNMAGYFAWNTEEAIKCASFFRRIYEEVSYVYLVIFTLILCHVCPGWCVRSAGFLCIVGQLLKLLETHS